MEAIEDVLALGTARDYGRRFLTTHLRVKYGVRARINDVRVALQQVDKLGTTLRRPDKKRKRRWEAIFPGPNWVWSIDGHDKLGRNYGIWIYAAIDAYSRKIIWIYVGSSNRTAVSVAKQHLEVTKAMNWCPRYFRANRGKETLMLADAHFALFLAFLQQAGFNDDDLNAVKVRDCFLYGTSTANVRIEATWRKMISLQTSSWMVGIIPLNS